jgi:hypothetical protein
MSLPLGAGVGEEFADPIGQQTSRVAMHRIHDRDPFRGRFRRQDRGICSVDHFHAMFRHRETLPVILHSRRPLGEAHFLSSGLVSGYFARSACHFLTSSGLSVAV